MENIEIYHHSKGVSPELRVVLEEEDLIRDIHPLSPGDKKFIEKNWKRRGYSYNGEVGSLASVSNTGGTLALSFWPTDYATYTAIAFPYTGESPISDELKGLMRISSFGCVLETEDGRVIVQKRPKKLIAGGTLDSGVAGIGQIKEGTINLLGRLRVRMPEEVGIEYSKLSDPRITGVFSARGPERIPNEHTGGAYLGGHSGMVSFAAEVSLEFEELRRKSPYEIYGIEKEELPDFIIGNAAQESNEGRLVADGCAALMCSLSPEGIEYVIRELNRKEGAERVQKGSLRNGIFTRD